jgi:hypothetical protein
VKPSCLVIFAYVRVMIIPSCAFRNWLIRAQDSGMTLPIIVSVMGEVPSGEFWGMLVGICPACLLQQVMWAWGWQPWALPLPLKTQEKPAVRQQAAGLYGTRLALCTREKPEVPCQLLTGFQCQSDPFSEQTAIPQIPSGGSRGNPTLKWSLSFQ